METRKRLAVSGIVILTILPLLVLAVGIALAQDTNPTENINKSSESEDAAAVSSVIPVSMAIPIQGRLTDASGNPLTGNYSVTARIYNASTGGTELCSDTDPVAVDNGLFNMYLDGSYGCTSADIDGKQIYLGIQVGSDPEMTPRQGIYAVPYAWSLRPGAIISSTTSAPIIHIENWGNSGRGLRSYAMATSGVNYGVIGASRSPDGFGGYFYNTAAIGSGVKGEGAVGVRGLSDVGSGVYGLSNGIGVYGETNNPSENYGLYTPNNLYSLNIHTLGAEMQIVQNGGLTPLETGDVVVFSGIGEPLKAGSQPVIQVVGVDSANSTAVAGVVYSRYHIETLNADPEEAVLDYTPEGMVAPGEYLLVVVQGPVQVKASALRAPIRPGDLLSSASQEGYATKVTTVSLDGVDTALPGTILGKALESLDEGEALIYVFVTLQ